MTIPVGVYKAIIMGEISPFDICPDEQEAWEIEKATKAIRKYLYKAIKEGDIDLNEY